MNIPLLVDFLPISFVTVENTWTLFVCLLEARVITICKSWLSRNHNKDVFGPTFLELLFSLKWKVGLNIHNAFFLYRQTLVFPKEGVCYRCKTIHNSLPHTLTFWESLSLTVLISLIKSDISCQWKTPVFFHFVLPWIEHLDIMWMHVSRLNFTAHVVIHLLFTAVTI